MINILDFGSSFRINILSSCYNSLNKILNCGFNDTLLFITMYFISPALLFSGLLWILSFIIFSLGIWFSIEIKIILIEWSLFTCGPVNVTIPILLDPLGLVLSGVVLFISGNVIYFSYSYIMEEKFKNRFFHLVLIFILSINLLIFIPHIITLLIGWDGLGITSYILVIYYQNKKSLAAGIFTALRNRVGDVLILLRIAWCLNQGHWIALSIIRGEYIRGVIIILLIMAGMTKRAQIPFSRWLPAAIAAPTPVRALVHSSTLVTAGVFLLVRFYPFLHSLALFNQILLIISTLTIFIAGTAAIVECDLKKIIALSTLRQLGVIISRIALNLPWLALFHLITHALFKALLFICAGTIININIHSQDLRTVGSLYDQIPLSITCIIISKAALIGLPFMAGFYSKDLIIEITVFRRTNRVIIWLYCGATCLTAVYSSRFLFVLIWSPQMYSVLHKVNDDDKYCTTPIILLRLGAICRGAVLNWLIFFPYKEPIINIIWKLYPLFVVLLGIILTYLFINSKFNIIKISLSHIFLSLIWFLRPLTTQFMLVKPYYLGHQSLKLLDQGWYEILGPNGLFIFLKSLRLKLEKLNIIRISSHFIIIFVIFFIYYFW